MGADRQGDDCSLLAADCDEDLPSDIEDAPGVEREAGRGDDFEQQGPRGVAGRDRQRRPQEGAGAAVQGQCRAAEDCHRGGHVADGVRCSLAGDDVCLQADGRTQPHAGHCAREPRLRRQAGRIGGRLRRHRLGPEAGDERLHVARPPQLRRPRHRQDGLSGVSEEAGGVPRPAARLRLRGIPGQFGPRTCPGHQRRRRLPAGSGAGEGQGGLHPRGVAAAAGCRCVRVCPTAKSGSKRPISRPCARC